LVNTNAVRISAGLTIEAEAFQSASVAGSFEGITIPTPLE
jgi:hypothetical protein